MSPEVSVIVPTHGRPDLLVRAIESVMDQTWQDFEIIVVDDGSPRDVVLPYHRRLRVLRRGTRGGTATARNTGITEAGGRYLAFLDDDDYYLPGRLAAGLEAADRAEVSVCWARPSIPSAAGYGWRGTLEGNLFDSILNGRVPPIGTCTVLRQTGPLFDDRFAVSEDVDWWLRLAQSHSFTTVAEELYVVGVHDGPRKTRQTRERLRCRLLLLEKHADYFSSHPSAAAEQWKRAGGLALAARDFRTSRRSYWRSIRSRPDVRTALHLGRSLVASALPHPRGDRHA